MELDIAEFLAAVVDAAGGTVYVKSESLEEGFRDKAVAINYDADTDRFVVSLVDTDDIDYEEQDAV